MKYHNNEYTIVTEPPLGYEIWNIKDAPNGCLPFCRLKMMQPVWYREKELDVHGIPTGRTYKACSCLLCDSCGHKETVDGSFDEPYK